MSKIKNWILTFIAAYTGYGYAGVRTTPNVSGFGIYFTKFDGPSMADPAHLLQRAISIRIGTNGFIFNKGN
jgi:hypothetical protein